MDTPQIRFKGFDDDFIKTKLSAIANRITRRNQDLVTSLPLTISAKFGLVDQVTYFNNRVASENLENYLLLEKGDFAYNKSSSEGFPFGAVKQLQKYDLGALSTLYIAFRPKSESVDSDYLESYFDADNWHRSVEIRAAEGARNHGLLNISAEDFLDIPIKIPMALKEQKMISSLIRYMGCLIELEEQKIQKLKNLKQSMLLKMFPQNGSNVPEIRFQGFTDAWRLRRLEELINLGSGQDYKSLNTGDIPVYGTGGYMLSVDKALSITEDAIGIGRKGTINKPFILRAPFWTVDTLFFAIPRENQDLDYLFCIFQNVDWKLHDQSTGVPSLSRQSIHDVEVNICSQAEQEAIGNYFRNLDELIRLEEEKLNKLKNLKNSFLNKMFV